METRCGSLRVGRGAEIAKGLRGCCCMVCVPVVAMAVGLLAGRHWGMFAGVLTGIVSLFATANACAMFVARQTKSLTAVDCILPTVISIVCGTLFASIGLFEANFLSLAIRILSGVVLTVALFAYRSGGIKSAGWLVMPFLAFVYEIARVDLPADWDNILGLGVSTMVDVEAVSNDEMPFKEFEDAPSMPLGGGASSSGRMGDEKDIL